MPSLRGALAAVAAGSLLAAGGCGGAGPPPAAAPLRSAPSASTPACATLDGWDCDWQRRLAAATAHLARQPGQIGVVLRDRSTGAVWRAGAYQHATWTGSTIKLAMVTSLLERHRAGEIRLDAADRRAIADMLSWSSDGAADALWRRYGRDGMVPRFQRQYGMTGLTFVGGFDRYWGFMKCAPADLVNLMSYVLGSLNAEDRGYVVEAMRHVGSIQRWGVYAAGADWQPGNKNGWSEERDPEGQHWVTSSVGFAGPDGRYAVAVMYHLPPRTGTLEAGARAVSDAVALIFGAPTPAPIEVRPS